MPIKNELIGGYHCVMISNKFVLCQSVKREHKMEASAKPLMQGTVKTRIMQIKGLTETISIEAPILVGTGSLIDGRTLLNTQIDNVLQKHGATLPILSSATIKIDAENGASVSFVLESDGDASNTSNAFEVTDHDVSQLTNGIAHDLLNPSVSGYSATRVATFWDFRVTLGTFKYFIMEASINVKTDLQKKYFIPGADSSNDHHPIPTSFDGLNNAWGTMYPWIAVSGLSISGTGKAAVLLNDQSGTDYYFTDSGDSINYQADSALTIQHAGYTNTASQNFKIEIWQPVGTDGILKTPPDTDATSGVAWRNLFVKQDGTTPLFDLSKSIVTKNAVDINPGLITTDFEFYCYIL